LSYSRARVAVTVVFALNGALFASIWSRLPAIQERAAIGDGALGLALLCVMLGLLAAQLGAGALTARVGSRPLVLVGALCYATALVPVALARSLGALAASFAFLGLSNGMLDVSMNVHGLTVERGLRRPILSSLHAAFSFGALAGAAAGGAVAGAGVGVVAHLWTAAALGACVAVVATRYLLPPSSDAAPEGPLLARPTRALALIALFAFCALLSEGAVNDWAAVYLDNNLDSGQGPAAAGLAAFSLTMGIGRLAGDRLTEALGPVRLARGGAALAAAGMTIALAGAETASAIAGFAAMGLGLAALFPLALRAAAERSGTPGPAVAALSGMGYLAFVAGPPAVGGLAEAAGLRSALVLVVALCVSAAALAGSVSTPVSAPRRN
jgi:MFS family permease